MLREGPRAVCPRLCRCEHLGPVCTEDAVDLPADLAALRVAVFPLVCVDAERDVGLAVPEAALDVDDGEVHGAGRAWPRPRPAPPTTRTAASPYSAAADCRLPAWPD